MTEDTAHGSALGIGDLARLTGVPVRTIRFYCDEGILDSVRSGGGHRRFDPSAADRLGLIRRLRGLGVPLPSITDVLTGRRSLAEVIAAERAAADLELASLAWRRACLRAVEDTAPAARPARLSLLATAQDGAAARDTLVTFWSRFIVAPMSDEAVDMFLAVSAPRPPADPAPEQVVAYAEMVSLAADRSFGRLLRTRSRANRELIADETALLDGVGRACLLARPLVLAGRPPSPGLPLDRFVDAHATVRGARDTPAFRRALLAQTAADRDPRLRRYWRLAGTVTDTAAVFIRTHGWLLDALERSVLDVREGTSP